MMFCIPNGSCSRCKIVVTKYHLHTDSEKIRIKIGVRFGDPISPKLFTATPASIIYLEG